MVIVLIRIHCYCLGYMRYIKAPCR